MIASLLQVSKHFIIQSNKEKPESQCSDQSTDDSGFWLCQELPIINDDGVILRLVVSRFLFPYCVAVRIEASWLCSLGIDFGLGAARLETQLCCR